MGAMNGGAHLSTIKRVTNHSPQRTYKYIIKPPADYSIYKTTQYAISLFKPV